MANSLPSWRGLVRRCEASVGVEPHTDSEVDDRRTPGELQEAMEEVAQRCSGDDQLRDLIQNELYADLGGTYPDEILTSKLLIAVGSLVMPSRRGNVSNVVTLNFDDLLEWYLHLHGFRTNSVTELPAYLRSDVDVTIYHPHGFLPLSDLHPRSNWTIFRYSEYVNRLAGSEGQAWNAHMSGLFSTTSILAVGASMGDIDIDVQMSTARQGRPSDDLPAGFVVGSGIDTAKQRKLRSSGLVPVSLPSRDDVPAFLLQVCRLAAQIDASVGSDE